MTLEQKQKKAALWRTPANPRWKDGKGRERELATRKDRLQRIKDERIDYINSIKLITPCTDCKTIYPPCCMDFDHLDASTKLGSINKLRTASWEKLKAEIAKCELVCSNCHRVRTTKRKRGIALTDSLTYH